MEYDILKAIDERYSARKYLEAGISGEDKAQIATWIEKINAMSGLHVQARYNDPGAFDTIKAYGSFSNVNNYLCFVGNDDKDLEEKCGYYGELLVLYLTAIGIGTCFVAASYSRSKVNCEIKKGEKLCIVVAFGYPEPTNYRHVHKKTPKDVSNMTDSSPIWFKNGVIAALKAPTAINQQQFYLKLLEENKVEAKAKFGFYSKIDLGIVKCNFEIAAGKTNFTWKA